MKNSSRAFTLIEVTIVATIMLVLAACLTGAGWKVYETSSLAVSANTLRQLASGASQYLGDHNQTFWPYRADVQGDNPGRFWWFGFETLASQRRPEGQRQFDPALGPLGGYVAAAWRPDPSFALNGRAFKPKYQSGYLGIGYNILLGGGWTGDPEKLKNYWKLSDPSQIVVFATSAQVNTFQSPASSRNPLLEEFYSLDLQYRTVHFRHHGQAMVAFANGSAGFLPMDESTRDNRMPKANVGRFAPINDKKYLE
jgi:prepilin-type N-terminal cleavage/methylation domain-containing protein